MTVATISEEIAQRWSGKVQCTVDLSNLTSQIHCGHGVLPELCGWLFLDLNLSFAGLIAEEGTAEWQLQYSFYGEGDSGWIHVIVRAPVAERRFPSIVKFVHAADWHEREIEDLFGLVFEGHPRLGDFVLHNDAWQESVEPMRHAFDARAAMLHRQPDAGWRPQRIVQEPGAFVMPVGPKYSGVTESVHFLLETVGEDVIRSTPRLFYKWRAIEKLAEGKTVEQVLPIAERFAATTAFAHGLAFCLAVESICRAKLSARAKTLRVFLAELERLRQHAGAIQEICESTALAVANSQAAILEEDLLRVSGELTGHRYLFGMISPGGLTCDLSDDACYKTLRQSRQILNELNELESRLRKSSSFLDRLEEVGVVDQRDAKVYGLLGPIARASGLVRDLRRARSYSDYQTFDFDVPSEREGDGYARLRILFAEARQSVRIMEQAAAALKPQDVGNPIQFCAGAALGAVEAPRGAAFHWVRMDEMGRIARYRIIPPSFHNWHGFHLAVEDFAFQDFPIMLSTFDLSVAENDR
jgi:Ni,Fe-hydrogenase III large subunit/Ni,Fe-hydrogenase III component G